MRKSYHHLISYDRWYKDGSDDTISYDMKDIRQYEDLKIWWWQNKGFCVSSVLNLSLSCSVCMLIFPHIFVPRSFKFCWRIEKIFCVSKFQDKSDFLCSLDIYCIPLGRISTHHISFGILSSVNIKGMFFSTKMWTGPTRMSNSTLYDLMISNPSLLPPHVKSINESKQLI